VTFIVGSLLVAIWPQAKNKPPAPAPVTKSVSANFASPSQGPRSESEFYQRVEKVIEPNDPNSYLQAIAMAEKVPSSDPSYAQVQKSIADWSEEIYVIANAHAQKKEWKQAIQVAKLVPRDSALYPAARNAIRLWRLYLAGKPLPASLP
jgi:predicted component of type VI protein secretion system